MKIKRKRGRIFVLSSPSGAGKTTVLKSLKKERFNIRYSVSATTRKRRTGEKGGVDYIFLNKTEFGRRIREKRFLEWTNNFGDLYGTPKRPVEECVSGGEDIVLSIDVKGAMQVKRAYDCTAVLVFLVAPNFSLLRERLKRRQTEDKRSLAKRLKAAKKELTYLNRYDYVIVNDSLGRAVSALKSIITAERHKVK